MRYGATHYNHTCPGCQGCGAITCAVCAGLGYTSDGAPRPSAEHAASDKSAAGEASQHTCPVCHATGAVRCELCHGKGTRGLEAASLYVGCDSLL